MKQHILFFVLLVTAWQICSYFGDIAFLFGQPTMIVKEFVQHTIDLSLPYDFLITALPSLGGFFLGSALAIATTALLWYYRSVANIAAPYIFLASVLPAFAFAPMIIIWFGIGLYMKLALATLASFLVVVHHFFAKAKSIDDEQFRLLRLYGASKLQLLKFLILPAVFQDSTPTFQAAAGASLLGAFIGEFIAANAGLGHFMLQSGAFFNISAVWAGSVYLALLGVLLHKLPQTTTFLKTSRFAFSTRPSV